MSEENLEIVRRGFTAFAEGDAAAWLQDMDPDVFLSGSHMARNLFRDPPPGGSGRDALGSSPSPMRPKCQFTWEATDLDPGRWRAQGGSNRGPRWAGIRVRIEEVL